MRARWPVGEHEWRSGDRHGSTVAMIAPRLRCSSRQYAARRMQFRSRGVVFTLRRSIPAQPCKKLQRRAFMSPAAHPHERAHFPFSAALLMPTLSRCDVRADASLSRAVSSRRPSRAHSHSEGSSRQRDSTGPGLGSTERLQRSDSARGRVSICVPASRARRRGERGTRQPFEGHRKMRKQRVVL